MPSFTSLYDATEDIDLGDGFYCSVKKFLTEEDFRAASGALVRNRKFREAGQQTEITGDFDAFAYNHTLVARALVKWNLTKDNPRDKNLDPLPIPITDYTNGKFTLPQPVFRKILSRVLELNSENDDEKTDEEKREEAMADADFRSEDNGGPTED